MSDIRTRFAPSPTGWLHIGGIRTALYAFLYARAQDGDFILRIEDTDKKREVEGAIEFIYKSLRLAGINWDEGPDVGGDCGPYIQSERMCLYEKYAHNLVTKGGGYYCFCKEDRVLEEGELDPCRDISIEESKKRVEANEPFVVRQKIDRIGNVKYYDQIYGEITFKKDELDEGVMLKSDKLPTYNFANVIDDHLMGITHVMRGNEYLSSTPKYQLLYEAFGWKSPKYIHLTQIMKDKHKKLSKRDASASFMDLIDKGYLPEAIVNYVALSGWHPKDDRELFTLDELIKVFSIKGLQKAPALFDQSKLDWMNGQYIFRLSKEEFHKRALEFYPEEVKKRANLEYLSGVLHKRTNYFGQIPELVDFLIERPTFSKDLYENEKMQSTTEIAQASLEKIIPILEEIDNWKEDVINEIMFDLVKKMGLKTGQVLWPLRIALSGKEFTPGGPIEIATILGKEETINRFSSALKELV
jgi:glutamyl-tRNA synthetase